MAPRPHMGAENWNFLKLLKTMIVGALWLRLGLLSIRILCFLKSDKNRGVTLTAPNFAKFQYFSIKLVLFVK